MMKAITLWEPWATLMALGRKRNETRSWSTNHRGLLAIHSSLRRPDAVARRLIPYTDGTLTFGAVLAVVKLKEVKSTHNLFGDWILFECGMDEMLFGDYSDNRFAWLTTHLQRLKEPVPCCGRQGLWTLPPEIETLVRNQLPS